MLIAPGWASRVSWDEGKVYVALSRPAIKDSPEWIETPAINRELEVHLYGYYGRPVYWDADDRVAAGDVATLCKERAPLPRRPVQPHGATRASMSAVGISQ